MTDYDIEIRAEDGINPIEAEEVLQDELGVEVRGIQPKGKPVEPELEDEIRQACEVLVALLRRTDEVRDEDSDYAPLEESGRIIQVAGYLRDHLPYDDRPTTRQIDPEDVFDN